jgi:hypothetical protein
MKRLKELIAAWTKIRNRSVYVTVGSSIGAVVKGQAEDYYDIDAFLQVITKELLSAEVATETILVASRQVRASTRIDFERAEERIIENELRTLIPELGAGSSLRTDERGRLTARYVEIRDKLREDRQGVLRRLIQAKARGSADEIARLLTFFPSLEDKLRERLVPLVVRLYGNNWQKAIDELKSKEGVAAKKMEEFVFGDLCKLYKRIVLDKRIIDIAPLTDEEFCAVMDAAPGKRNEFAHRQPDLKRWDDLFSFCSAFIPIYSRLLAAIDNPAD